MTMLHLYIDHVSIRNHVIEPEHYVTGNLGGIYCKQDSVIISLLASSRPGVVSTHPYQFFSLPLVPQNSLSGFEVISFM